MTFKKHALAGVAMAAALAATPAHAIEIRFDYRYDTRGFFTDLSTGLPIAERRAVLEAAASVYAGFSDTLAPIAPAAGDTWSVRITHPSLGGNAVTLNNLEIAADTLTVFVGGSASAPGVLGFANTGFSLTATGSAEFVDSVLTRGQANTTGPNATDYGVWGGMIWFNATPDWHFGLDSPAAGSTQNDFYTTAVHELGHILGFGEADSWVAQVDASGRFAGAASVAAYGGPVPLDDVQSHWARNTLSVTPDGRVQGALMDPSTAAGTREVMTVLDLAGFADIGWQVSAVPEPSAAMLLASGMALLAWRRRSAQRASSARCEGGNAASSSFRKA